MRKTDKQFEESFWSKVRKTDECWSWTGRKVYNGYGSFYGVIDGVKYWRAHRYAYVLTFGPIPKGMVVMHKCDTPYCVNSEHLKIGTSKENNTDRDRKSRTYNGDGHHAQRLMPAQVLEAFDDKTSTHAALARKFGVHGTTIANIRHGKKWRWFLVEQGRISGISGISESVQS